MIRWFIIILVLHLLNACTVFDRKLKLNSFHEGMTRTELTVANGLPGKIHVNENRELWQYCRRDLFQLLRTSLVNVLLINGRVARFDIHSDGVPRNCEDLYVAFSWETARYGLDYK